MMRLTFFVVVFVCFLTYVCNASSPTYTKKALEQEVTELPGIPDEANFRMFSGLIPLNKEGTKKMFYWYVESEKDAASDPITLWTNGGPGCSGLSGFMTELGPFRPLGDGNLTMNPQRWNKITNMVFIEQPVGVGFSEVTIANMTYGDDMAATDNWLFVKGFFEQFPHLKNNDFYLSSESYGGHYIPTLAAKLLEKKDVPNFKGFLVGNPLIWMPYTNYGQFGTLYGHQMLPKTVWDKYVENECWKLAHDKKCVGIVLHMSALTMNVNPYALDFPTKCADNEQRADGLAERMHMREMKKRFNLAAMGQPIPKYWPSNYQPCNGHWSTEYLNRPDVQKAIHARVGAKWGECSGNVSMAYNVSDGNVPMMPVLKDLVENVAGIKMLIYSGDDDTICATMSIQQWIWDMDWNVSSEWKPWLTEEQQLGGMHVEFTSKTNKNGGLMFSTVHGAGHMVPSTRPNQMLEVLDKFLNDKEW